jgi:uncharacterized protein (DUF849 family)
VPRIKRATDAVINITTGGSTRMTLEERLAYPLQAQARDVLAEHGLDEFLDPPGRAQVPSGASTGRSPTSKAWKT